MKSNSKNQLVRLISLCGQIAEHKSEKMQQHEMDEAQLLTSLSAEEQETLSVLLTKLQTKWISDHKEHMDKK